MFNTAQIILSNEDTLGKHRLSNSQLLWAAENSIKELVTINNEVVTITFIFKDGSKLRHIITK